ncbi:MAG: FHA domain-containing protein [Planctomycetes bacterium]|nr:FHA domain-containing protein [Planctomycetota bacterium]
MKVSLVVTSGSHEGRSIPLTGPQFLIGRDPQCQLRPASQAISKLHCAVLIRDGKVYIKDYGSTNGTLVNDALVQDAEVAVADGDVIRVGPLDFRLKIEAPAAKPDGTPLPGGSGEAAALAAVKAAAATAATGTAPKVPRDTTPAPQPAAKPAKAPAPQPAKPVAPTKPGGSAEAPALKSGSQETPALTSSESVTDEDHDRIASMLLGMDEEGNAPVPDGSTVMDIPSPLAGGTTEAAKVDDKKKDDKKKAQTREEMSDAASDLLRKYMRRPK